MITKNEILTLHKLSIEKYGGADGIRDEGLLESAIIRPYQTLEVKTCIILYMKEQQPSAKAL